MPKFSKRSLVNLATCHLDLQKVAQAAIGLIDFTVIVGHRTKTAQHEAFVKGFSKLDWPLSKHNKVPSEAFDFIPSPFVDTDWKSAEGKKKFLAVQKVIVQCGKDLGITIETIPWDAPHIQVKLGKKK